MACNCNSHSLSDSPVNGSELGFWPIDWLERKATEFCMEKAYEQITPIVFFILALLALVILGGRLKWD
ncbi:hypothetical protein [Leptospira stimsonii]|uniref:Uncharacterized protein n=1 Tax=Leptospira stimsonii TaxID=2202203 RepID=A0ABY2MV98_9LEPT|nr:hypothetical protein [Leptospira stimsonii]TGK25372.1 hypothetical protein EHO98_02950 [Leptospira stimsonii]TGM08791.1 hypothetical protein EHQ90_22135 [Leptospira stimsonii]